MSTSELPRIYVTLAETAQMMGYKSTRTVQRKIKAGELEARGKGKGLRVVYASVLRHPDYAHDRRLN
jgi:hypothetical protein